MLSPELMRTLTLLEKLKLPTVRLAENWLGIKMADSWLDAKIGNTWMGVKIAEENFEFGVTESGLKAISLLSDNIAKLQLTPDFARQCLLMTKNYTTAALKALWKCLPKDAESMMKYVNHVRRNAHTPVGNYWDFIILMKENEADPEWNKLGHYCVVSEKIPDHLRAAKKQNWITS
jgi:hypothetical protein